MTVTQLDRAILVLLLCYALVSSISIAAIDAAILLSVVLAAWRRYQAAIPVSFDRKLLGGNLSFVGACFLSMAVANEPVLSFNWGWNFFNNMLPLFLTFFFIRSNRHIVFAIYALALSLALSSVYAIFQGLNGIERASGFLSSLPPQTFAGVLDLLLLLMAVVLLVPQKQLPLRRPFLACAAALGCMALLFNGTRGVWVSILILLIPLCFQLRHYRRHFLAFCLLFFMLSAVILAVPAFQERLLSLTKIHVGHAESQRLYKWQMASTVFLEHPVLGVGADNYKLLDFERYLPPEAKERSKAHAHNIFFNVLAETGSIGIIAFLFMFMQICKTLYQQYRLHPDNALPLAALYCTAGLLLYGMTEFIIGDFIVMRLYWFIIGLAWISFTMKNQKGF